MHDLDEKIISAFEEKPMIEWRYIENIFLLGNLEENLLKNFSVK